jgi:hypothetical protein
MKIICCIAALLLPACLFAEDPQAIFAFANRAGTHLLALNVDNQGRLIPYEPAGRSKAVCAGNWLLDVAFEQHQKSGTQNTGRQTSANFSQLEGDRFRLVSAKVGDDEVCLLLERSLAESLNLLPLKRSVGAEAVDANLPACSIQLRAKLQQKYQREITRCSMLATIANTQFAAAEFKPNRKGLLAAAVLAGKEITYSRAEPAECQNGYSGWRVDDDCKFDPGSLVPLFAWKRSDGAIEIGVEWQGAEGGNLILFRGSGSELQKIANSYRYWAPL